MTAKRKVFVLDFNVWGEVTDPCLFSWSELNAPGSLPVPVPAAAAAAVAESGETGTTGDVQAELEGGSGLEEEHKCPASASVSAAPAPSLAPTELRVVETDGAFAPAARLFYGLPKDMLDLGDSGGVEKAIARMQQAAQEAKQTPAEGAPDCDCDSNSDSGKGEDAGDSGDGRDCGEQ